MLRSRDGAGTLCTRQRLSLTMGGDTQAPKAVWVCCWSAGWSEQKSEFLPAHLRRLPHSHLSTDTQRAPTAYQGCVDADLGPQPTTNKNTWPHSS